MQITPIIERLREVLPSWGNRIAGAAEYAAVEDLARLQLPAMYVILGQDSATTLSNPSFLLEIVETFSIIVVLDNKNDRRGQTAQDQIHLIREAIFIALLNYPLNPANHTLEYVSGRMLDMDKARYFYEFTFSQRTWLGDEDGAQPSLENFDKFYADYNLTQSDPDDHPDAQDHLENLYNP